MSKELPEQKQSEEVDLSQVIRLLGKAFDRLVSFIASIFKGAFNLLILFLLFTRKYFVKFLVIVLLGFVVGVFLDRIEGPIYVSSMQVEPNFNSVEELYKNINFYHQLVEDKDSVALSEVFGITVKEAKSLKEFKVAAYADKNQKLKLFDDFVKSLDTVTRKSINPEKFFNNFNTLSLRFHLLTIRTTDNAVAKKIEPVIIEAFKQNDYFNLQKSVSDSNRVLKESYYAKQLSEIDSLQKLYKNIMLKEVNKPVAGTNISLGDNVKKENKELVLMNKKEDIQLKLVELNVNRANKLNVINVITAFPDKGLKELVIIKTYKFLIPASLLGFSFLVFGLFSLNNYLKGYINKD